MNLKFMAWFGWPRLKLSPRARAGLFLVALVVALDGIGYAWNVRTEDAQRAGGQRAGMVLEQKLCATFGRLAALKPPGGNPKLYPSRGYLQEEHATLVSLGTDLGCR